MLLTIFSGLYELISGANPDVPDYVDGVYDTVGQITLVLLVALAIIFYLLLGRWKPIFYKLGHWIFTLLVIMAASFAIAFVVAHEVIGEIDSYTYRFSLMNAIFSAVAFLLLSTAFKRMSIFSKRTPF